jgi:vacuolar protein sorting-associated protein 33A
MASVSIHKLQLDIFPLEPDVLSLESYTAAMKEMEVDGISSMLITTVAWSLLKIQDVVGMIPGVQSLGPMGEEVVHKMFSLHLKEHLASSSELSDVSRAAEVGAMIIMDCKVDLVTPMVMPLTYEGLLDYILRIDSRCILCFRIHTFSNLN